MTQPYRVLARKYRPQTFHDLVGQDVLVRTLTNAIRTGRIAHAFLLTGIRGIGKTTTARIIARALNCVGPDGDGGPTIDPCGVCPNCRMIAEDRHVDVLEMDAASHTGVGDIRDLIETVHYAPTNARYKIYIIDEVHMLSTSAFNALLKTLEEPPPRVIFIFATTEIRKIPVTILSRCQRFDLKRLSTDQLTAHLVNISGKEEIAAEEEALRLIAIAAEGSVRDGLSLLDRVIAHGDTEARGILPSAVRTMLGLADRTRLFELLEDVFTGNVQSSLERLNQHYADGADMVPLLQDLLGLVHVLTRLQAAPATDLGPSYSDHERDQANALSKRMNVPELSRAWQMLLKGIDEIRRAPDALSAAEMVIIRLCHTSRLPSPGDLMREWKQAGVNPVPVPTVGASASVSVPVMRTQTAMAPQFLPAPAPEARGSHLTLAASNPEVAVGNFEALLDLLDRERAILLYTEMVQSIELVSFEEGRIALHLLPSAKADTPQRLRTFLEQGTRRKWTVSAVAERGQKTIAAKRMDDAARELAEAAEHPLAKAVLEAFPGSRMIALRRQEKED